MTLALFLRSDVRARIEDRRVLLRSRAETSRRHYDVNRCDPATRVPAMDAQCAEWEISMKRRVGTVELTRIVVEVFGESCDTFVATISTKTCVVAGAFFVLFLLFRNSRIGT